jgi:hypothetical protein
MEVENEKDGVMEYQREMARAGLYTLGFANLIDSKLYNKNNRF